MKASRRLFLFYCRAEQQKRPIEHRGLSDVGIVFTCATYLLARAIDRSRWNVHACSAGVSAKALISYLPGYSSDVTWAIDQGEGEGAVFDLCGASLTFRPLDPRDDVID